MDKLLSSNDEDDNEIDVLALQNEKVQKLSDEPETLARKYRVLGGEPTVRADDTASVDSGIGIPRAQGQSEPEDGRKVMLSHPGRTNKGLSKASGSSFSLPVELNSLILHSFWDDNNFIYEEPRTLKVCLSVSRAWRYSARHYVFRAVTLISQRSLERLDLLIQSDPSVASLIQKVELRCWFIDKRNVPWIYNFPSMVHAPLPCLKILAISEFDQRRPRKKDVKPFSNWLHGLQELSSVRQLNLRSLSMPPNAMKALVCAFPKLDRVWMEKAAFEGIKDVAPIKGDNQPKSLLGYPALHPIPPIERVYVNPVPGLKSFDFNAIKDWLVPRTSPPTLKVLNCWARIDHRSLTEVLAAASSSLEFLQVHTFGMIASEVQELWRALPVLSKLKTFCVFSQSEPELADCYLQFLNAPNLETVAFMTRHNKWRNEGCIFQGMDQYLTTDKFSHLKKICFECAVEPNDSLDERRALYEEYFPLARKRGILEITLSDSFTLYR